MFTADERIVSNRAKWDARHPKHDVVLSDYEENEYVIPNDNSVMTEEGPMFTPEAIEFMKANPLPDDFYVWLIDGNGDPGM